MTRSLRTLALCSVLGSAVLTGTASLAGCSQPVVPTSAVAAAEAVAQTAAVVVSDAQVVWPVVYALIPAAQQPAAQAAFNAGLFAANHAILALNDAVQAAVAVNTPNPNFSALIAAISDAVSQVVSIVQNFEGQAPAAAAQLRSASGVDAVGDMQAASARLKALAKE
jgi:hypothetical protein